MNLIKKMLPTQFKRFLKIQLLRRKLFSDYRYDAKLYYKHSNILAKSDTQKKLIASIVRQYHIIEKGLTMPGMRLGFGIQRINSLIDDCFLYAGKFDVSNEQFKQALSIIAEYKHVHQVNAHELEVHVLDRINEVLLLAGDLQPTKQLDLSRKEYFSFSKSSFDQFSGSRRSVRSFSGNVSIDNIEKAITLAQNAPSACNRQPARVYVVKDIEIIAKVLDLQKGNRGFGHQADKLIVVTAELGGYMLARERNGVFVDGGMYAMNLLYSLHFFEIATCILNWSSEKEDDASLNKLLDIPDSERTILIIACGNTPENFKLAISKRNNVSHTIRIR